MTFLEWIIHRYMPKGTGEMQEKWYTVLSLINAPGALQFFKRGMFIRGKFSMQKYSV